MSDVLELGSTLGPVAPAATRSRAAAYLELTKPRIAGMVLIATWVGFYLSLPAGVGFSALVRLIQTLLGTALVAGGANALNQYWEADWDRRMIRTRGRPLPSGRLTGEEALLFAVSTAVVGVIILALRVNLLSGVLAALSLVSYVFVYTPLKRATSLCVYVGAVPGALPPVIGWAAGAGSLATEAWVLFAIVFFWQLPHFAAIAWQYREDYARAGYPMLPVVDPNGRRTTLHVVTHTVALIAGSIVPVLGGMAGPTYAVAAMVLGTAFLGSGLLFGARRTTEAARLHVLASVTYLPLLLVILLFDRSPLV